MPATRITREPAEAQAGAQHSMQMRAFADSRALSHDEMRAAAVGWPRPTRLLEELELPAGKFADGMRTLGLTTVGELLEHLPRDSREARTVAALAPGEQATVAVQVRSISARPVRRRGMRPLVQATVHDPTGSMRATFFNQPWLVERYPPGTHVVLHGKADERGGFRVSHHALGAQLALADPDAGAAPGEGSTQAALAGGEAAAGSLEDAPAGRAVAHYAASEGVSSTQILALVQGIRDRIADVVEPLAARTRTAESLPDRASALAAMHFARGARDSERGRERLAFDELLLTQLLFLHRRARRSSRSRRTHSQSAPQLSAPLAHRGPALRTDRRSAAHVRGDRRRSARHACDAAPADGGGGQRQDRRRALRDAARGRARTPGCADGADRDARRTALRDDPAAARRRERRVRAADRLHLGAPARRCAGQARQRRALADRRYARADRAGRPLRVAGGRRGRRAAPLRRAPARGAACQGRRRTRCT